MKLFAMIAMLAFSMVAFAEEPAQQQTAPEAAVTEQAPAPKAEKKTKKAKKSKKAKKEKTEAAAPTTTEQTPAAQ